MTEPRFIHPLEETAESWPEELDHISASSVKMLVRCPEQWRQRYILGRKLPPAVNLLAGRADHSAIEHSMTQKVTSYVDLPVGDVTSKFLSDFEDEIEKEGGLAEIEVPDATGKSAKAKKVGQMKEDGQKLVAKYHREVSPVLQPVAVELPIVLRPKLLPVRVEGYIDLIVTDAYTRGGEKRIIDRKRVGSVRTQPEWRIQAEVYQLGHPYPHDWHLSVTTKVPRIALPEGDLVEKLTQAVPPAWKAELTLTHICAEIGHYYLRYGPDEPWPSKGRLHPWACNYCGFRKDCWGWREQ